MHEEIMNDREEEFEYHVTFPGTSVTSRQQQQPARTVTPSALDLLVPGESSRINSNRNGSGDDFVFVYEEEKRPLVVLLGWAGCQDKYLAKYSAIYEERSCITLRCMAPVEVLFWRRDRLPRISRRLIQVITEKCTTEHPVFFHVFSNGGAFFYQHISLALQQAGTPLKVKGVIFDSSPGERRLTSAFRAISAIIGGHPLTNLPISFFITFFLSVYWLLEILVHSIGKGSMVKSDLLALAEETYSWPQIFLYSNADTLIPASDVEKFASRRAERGVRTQLVLFTDSPHVKHYATYRDVYVSTVCGFINECLSESNQETITDERKYEENDSLRCLTKRIVLPQEASNKKEKEVNFFKLAYRASKLIPSQKVQKETPAKPFRDSIENFKRIHALTVFVTTDDEYEEPKLPERPSKIKKEKIKTVPKKFDYLNYNSNTFTKKAPCPSRKTSKKPNNSGQTSNNTFTSKLLSLPSYRHTTTVKGVPSIQRSKNNVKVNSEKMSVERSAACSKDHKAIEKSITEKYMEKLKKPTVKRIPATQKCIYTFGEVGIGISYKGEQKLNVDDDKKPTPSKKKRSANRLKRQESTKVEKDPQLSQIEKQLKEIHSQKKKINQIIFKELGDPTSNWEEMRNKTSLLNVKNTINLNSMPHIKNLCENLEKSTRQVESLHRTITDVNIIKKQSTDNRANFGSDSIEYRYGRGDNIEICPLKNLTEPEFSIDFGTSSNLNSEPMFKNTRNTLKEPVDRLTKSILKKYPSNVNQIDYINKKNKMRSESEFAADMLSRMNITASPRRDSVTCSEVQCGPDSSIRNDKPPRLYDLKDIEGMTRNCDVSSQASTSVTKFQNKYPRLNNVLPELLNSQYLSKACFE